jgi:hypothetical protein
MLEMLLTELFSLMITVSLPDFFALGEGIQVEFYIWLYREYRLLLSFETFDLF